MTTENAIRETEKTWAEVVMGYRKPKRSRGSDRFTRNTGTQMIGLIQKKFNLFLHTEKEIKQFCLDYLGVGSWTRRIWNNCTFPQFLRKSGVCDYLTVAERRKIRIENPFVCKLERLRRISVAPCIRYGRPRTDFYGKPVDYAYLCITPTTKIMHKICEDGISKYFLIILNTVTREIQRKQLNHRYIRIENGRQVFWTKMPNLTGADLVVTIADNKNKNVYKTLMPKMEIPIPDDRTCTICLDEVDPAGAFIPTCGHMFHISCMREAAYSEHGRYIFPDVRTNYKCTNHACEHTMMSPMTFTCPNCRRNSNVHV